MVELRSEGSALLRMGSASACVYMCVCLICVQVDSLGACRLQTECRTGTWGHSIGRASQR